MRPSVRIYKLLKQQVLIPYEWGFYAPSYTDLSLSFKVRGLAFDGLVKILGSNYRDTYTISFINHCGEIIRKAKDIREEELVDVLRANIDGSNSWERIKEMYFLKSEVRNVHV